MALQKLTYSTTIDAPRDVIWRVLLDDATYREWTAAFGEGSYAVTDWKEGSKALFLTPEGNGVVSRIAAHRPNEYLSIEHLGTVKEGVEDPDAGAKEGWDGARENYTLRETPAGVEILIEMDTTPAYADFMNNAWPKGLAKIKELAEGAADRPFSSPSAW